MTVNLDPQPFNVKDTWHNINGYFAKVFLISDKRNGNGWRVTWESIEKRAESFVGFPGIEYTKCTETGCDLNHVHGRTYNSVLSAQKQYQVSTIYSASLHEPTHTAYAIHHVSEDFFKRVMQEDQDIYVSPSIWRLGEEGVKGYGVNMEKWVDVYDWLPLHSAYVHVPAYGPEAKVVSKCHGMGGDCAIQLDASQSKAIPVIINHHGQDTLFTPPEEIAEQVTAAVEKNEDISQILESYQKNLNKNELPPMSMEKCEYSAISERIDAIMTRQRISSLEARLGAYSAAPGDEKSKEKPDVDEKGLKCSWVTSKGRKFQVCDESKSKQTTEKPTPSERREEKK